MYIHSDCFLISIENAGGAGPQLLDYSFLAMYDPKREKPWHHGGILIHYPDVYEACRSHAFGPGLFSDQKWTHIFWHKGIKLSGTLLQKVEKILFTVIDDEEE